MFAVWLTCVAWDAVSQNLKVMINKDGAHKLGFSVYLAPDFGPGLLRALSWTGTSLCLLPPISGLAKRRCWWDAVLAPLAATFGPGQEAFA